MGDKVMDKVTDKVAESAKMRLRTSRPTRKLGLLCRGKTGLLMSNYQKMKLLGLSELARRTKAPPISWLMAMPLARPQLISLAAGFTDNPSLPVNEVRELMGEMLRSSQTGQPALQYGTTAGDPRLRELVARDLRADDGLPAGHQATAPDRMVITSGSQQLLYMVTEALCDPGDIVLVEDPSYFVYLGILQSHGLGARGIRMENDGLDLAHLEAVLQTLKRNGSLRRVKLLYFVSYFQNPTSITTSFEKKAGALKLLRQFERAAGHPIYLLEDAAYRGLRFEGEEIKSSLCVRGQSERVLYGGTYSKPFATGVRIGFGLLPEPVLSAVLRIKGNHDFGTSNLLQQLLARAISSGQYAKHLANLRLRYAHKARVMGEAMTEHFPAAVEWQKPAGGLYIWARLPRSVKSGSKSKLFQTALANEVLYVPGELCYADDPSRRKPNHEMRLSFGAATEEKLRAGIARLGKAMHQLVQ
jgi:2-aminoadipate transaminase